VDAGKTTSYGVYGKVDEVVFLRRAISPTDMVALFRASGGGK